MMTQDQITFFFEKAKIVSDLSFHTRDGRAGIRLSSMFQREHMNSRMFRRFVKAVDVHLDETSVPTSVETYFLLAQKSLCMYNTWKAQSKGRFKIDFSDDKSKFSSENRSLILFRLWWAAYRGFPNGAEYHPYTLSQGFRVTGKLATFGDPIVHNKGTPAYLGQYHPENETFRQETPVTWDDGYETTVVVETPVTACPALYSL